MKEGRKERRRKKKKIRGRNEQEGEREREREKRVPLLFKNYGNRTISFLSEQKAKSIHASRATHGYQNLGVSSNSTR